MTDFTTDRRRFVVGAGTAATGTAVVGVGSASDESDRAADESDREADERGRSENDRATGDDSTPMIVAHRGFAGMAPENTVGAVEFASRGGVGEGAARRRAEMIEIDVMPTGDGDVVAFHDDRLGSRDGGERGLTDAEGVVWETPTDVVTSAEVLDSGETVPLLTEVLDAVPPSVGVNVEFKNPGSDDLRFAENLSGEALDEQAEVWRPFTERVLGILDRYDHDVLVSSFYEAALATVRETDDSIPVAPLLWDSVEAGLAVAREYDAEAVHPPYNMVEGTPFYADPYYTEGPWEGPDLLSTAHDEGRAVNVYTIATWYQARELAAAGVDGLIADYPGLLRFGSTE